jgi:hypothetical protein
VAAGAFLAPGRYDIFGRRRRHPEKRVDCAAKRKRKQRKPRIDAVIKAAEKTGAKVRGATVAADGTVSLQFADDVKPSQTYLKFQDWPI